MCLYSNKQKWLIVISHFRVTVEFWPLTILCETESLKLAGARVLLKAASEGERIREVTMPQGLLEFKGK